MPTANDGLVYGPIWLSKGEKFRPTGAYIFLEARYKECQLQLKILRKEHKEIMTVIKKRKRRTMIGNDNNETGDDGQITSTEGTDKEDEKAYDTSSIQNKSLLSMTKKELKELKEVKAKI